MKNEVYNSYYLATTSVSPSNNTISNPAASIIWNITRTNNNVSFYNQSANKYMYLYQSGSYYDLGLQDNANWFAASVSNGNWTFESNDCEGQYLVYFIYSGKTTVHEFAAKSSTSTTIQLYKQAPASTTYYSSSVSCGTTGIEDEIVPRQSSNRKFLKDGQLLILRDGRTYTLMGNLVE